MGASPDCQDALHLLKPLLQPMDEVLIIVGVTSPDRRFKEPLYLVLIQHTPKAEAPSACVALYKYHVGLTPFHVLGVVPEMHLDIAQANLSGDRNSPVDLVVKLTVKDEAMEVIFTQRDDMTSFIAKVKDAIAAANSTFSRDWMDAYRVPEVPAKPRAGRKYDMNAVSHVLPLQRAQTLADMKLKRAKTRTLTTSIANLALEGDQAKEHWINAQLLKREDEFVQWENIHIFSGTWNVHGSLPTESLATWLQGEAKDANGKHIEPDFYVIGLQEMESGTEAYLYYDPTKENAWVDAILNGLGPNKQKYYKVASLQLVTLLVIVIAKAEYRSAISEVDTCYAGVGLMNMIGNKGGCGVRLRLHDTYMCFMASHLAAFVNNCERRNQDFCEIAKRVLFKHQADPALAYVAHDWNGGGDEGVSYLQHNGLIFDSDKQASIFHADHLIWLGDLNYRLNLSEAEVKQRLAHNNYGELLEYDQLGIERRAGRTFPMFEEGLIRFAPTYKYDSGTNRYDTSTKRRAPSWTDRILWKKPSNPDKPMLTQLTYDNCMDMMLSDHKPVHAMFSAKVRHLDHSKLQSTRLALAQQLKDTKDDLTTKGKISTSFIEFGPVQFMEYKEKTLVLENTGQVVAAFRFIAKLDEPRVVPAWLQVSPQQGLLGPGEKVVIQFDLMIDASVSAPLNQGTQTIDDILILRLENGKDFFIVIKGEYQRTCFGVPLEALSPMSIPAMPNPATETVHSPPERRKRMLQAAKATLANHHHTEGATPSSTSSSASSASSSITSQQANLPKELWRLLTFLWNKSMLGLPTLFLEHGDRVLCDYIRKCLDDGDTFDPAVLLGDDGGQEQEARGANSVVDVLVAFLECLPEPVIPAALYAEALAASESNERVKLLKDKLPPLHLNVLIYISSFLADAVQYAPADVKEERQSCIVSLFTVLLRHAPDYKEVNPPLARVKMENFIRRLLSVA